jgi:hypothetical protein
VNLTGSSVAVAVAEGTGISVAVGTCVEVAEGSLIAVGSLMVSSGVLAASVAVGTAGAQAARNNTQIIARKIILFIFNVLIYLFLKWPQINFNAKLYHRQDRID